MISDLLNRLVTERGLILEPNYRRDISDPFLLSGMDRAVTRILGAIKTGEKVIIFADYDADGVPGAAVLSEFFKKVGFANFEVYIPNRHTEDYGLMAKSIREFAQNGAKLIITIDCAITNVVEVKLAGELGLDVIITDHHLPPEVLPPAFAIVNPKVPGDQYPDKMLCGAGVIFKVVQALVLRGGFEVGENWEKTLLDLVAIATISDRVPLAGENRALAKFGLMILQRTRRPGLLALFATGKIKRQFVTEDDIGFMIAPRLNAASRMSHASEAYFLLTTPDLSQAGTMAAHLEEKNNERKKLVEQILEAVENTSTSQELKDVIVVGNASWSPGVLGLAASKLAEKFGRSVFVWGGNNGEVKGSCRSDGTINLVELMRAAGGAEFFTAFGGHAAAGGFSLASGKVDELGPKLLAASKQVPKFVKAEEKNFDATVSLDEIGEEVWKTLEQLAPFGEGNPKPIFHFPNLEIVRAKTFGNGGIHLELSFKKTSGEIVCAIGFFTAMDKFKNVTLEVGRKIDLLATLEKSYFKTKPEIRLRIVDIR
ncbi:single-stranded-DNA-specific exonuclease RecJ [Candidatus Nomurabacteria bacterium]|nr:single-stranded-DNA-specific exonuclease RecJ [Candidatus Nomurabacteria bacterium]